MITNGQTFFSPLQHFNTLPRRRKTAIICCFFAVLAATSQPQGFRPNSVEELYGYLIIISNITSEEVLLDAEREVSLRPSCIQLFVGDALISMKYLFLRECMATCQIDESVVLATYL